jgi:hypothetical protein
MQRITNLQLRRDELQRLRAAYSRNQKVHLIRDLDDQLREVEIKIAEVISEMRRS